MSGRTPRTGVLSQPRDFAPAVNARMIGVPPPVGVSVVMIMSAGKPAEMAQPSSVMMHVVP
jgi:hypothetical protein